MHSPSALTIQEERLNQLLHILKYSEDRDEKMDALNCIAELAESRSDIRSVTLNGIL